MTFRDHAAGILLLLGMALASGAIAGTVSTIPPATAQELAGCKMQDLAFTADIPEGYTRVSTKCPMVAYIRPLDQGHRVGFYFIETDVIIPPELQGQNEAPTGPTKTRAIFLRQYINDQIFLEIWSYEQKFRGQQFVARQTYEAVDYPPFIVKKDGICGGIELEIPTSIRNVDAVERRKAIICASELPPSGSGDWIIIQAHFFEVFSERKAHSPIENFEQMARDLFHSIRLNGRTKAE